MSQVSPVDEASSEDEQADDDFGTFEGVLPVLQSTALANALGIPLNHRDSKMHRDEMAGIPGRNCRKTERTGKPR